MRAALVRQRLARVGVAIAIATATAHAAGAQQAPAAVRGDSALPFRRGQWGLDFGLGSARAYRLGAVRFTSPTRAWILDARFNGRIERQEQSTTDTTGSGSFYVPLDVIAQGGSAQLLVGRRAYRAMSARGMRTVSLSAGGGFGYDETLAEGRRVGRTMSSNATLQGAVGAHYRLTPSLALGGSLGLGATYTWAEFRADALRQRRQTLDVGLGGSELVLSLFF